MAFNPTPFNDKLTTPVTVEYKDKVRVSSFGNNYDQIVDLGIESITMEAGVAFAPLSLADMGTLLNFLNDEGVNPYTISEIIQGQTHTVRTVGGTIVEKISTSTYKVSWKVKEHKV